MDGVIVDSHPSHRLAWKKFLRSIGKEVSDHELDFVLDGRKRTDILFHFLGPLTDEQLERYEKRKDELFWHVTPAVMPMPGVCDFIERIHKGGINTAVATSASAGRARSILQCLGLLQYFRAIVTGDEVRDGKPDPSIYRLACQRIYCPPEAAVAVEDAASGVQAAKSAGLKCVGVVGHQSEERLTAAGADYVIRDFLSVSLRNLRSLVEKQPQVLPRA
jgi:HAD superfamily hydrolase (TIGR01509 family)